MTITTASAMGDAGSMPAGGMEKKPQRQRPADADHNPAAMKGSTVMTTTNELHPIWTDSSVMEALHGMHSVLGEWEQVGAAEEADLDSMEDVLKRFTESLGMFFAAMQTVQRRNRKRS